MGIISTPELLIGGDEGDYLVEYRKLFAVNVIAVPETPQKSLFVYTDKDEVCYHIWRGGKLKDWNDWETRQRAYRIKWIKFLIENQSARNVFLDKKTGNIVFASTELLFAVVVCDIGSKYKLVTSFTVNNPFRRFTKERYTELSL